MSDDFRGAGIQNCMCGLTYVLYSILNSFILSKPKCLLILPRIDLALEADLTHCCLAFKLLDTIIPISLSSSVSSSFQFFPWTFVSTEWTMCITSHFSGLKPNFHLSDHYASLLRSSCKTSPASNVEILVQTLASSANILTLHLIHSGISFT